MAPGSLIGAETGPSWASGPAGRVGTGDCGALRGRGRANALAVAFRSAERCQWWA